MDYEIFTEQPHDFRPAVEAAACYCAYEDTILLVKRHESSPQGNTWGIPGGKIEPGEQPREAVIREVQEEVGLHIDGDGLEEMDKFFVRLPHVDYVFHTFRKQFNEKAAVTLSSEHVEAVWATVNEALELPLIKGAEETLKHYVRYIQASLIRPKEFYFLRHGQTDHALGLKIDQHDIPLNATGLQQACDIASVIGALPVKTVCVSPLKRAKETMKLAGRELLAQECEIVDLTECSLDVWLGMTKLGPQAFVNGTDEVKAFMEQARRGINQALTQPGPVLIVAHGGIHWAMCCLMGVHCEWTVDNCVPVHFSWCDERGWMSKRLV